MGESGGMAYLDLLNGLLRLILLAETKYQAFLISCHNIGRS